MSLPYAVDSAFARLVSQRAFASALQTLTSLRNGLTSRFRKALRFVARSIDEEDPTTKLLFAVIALEALFSRDRDAQLKMTLADYSALVGFSRSDRLDAHRTMKKSYDLRSAVVHQGSSDVSREEADGAEVFAARVLVKALALLDRFGNTPQSENSFFDYLRDQKLRL